ncbi:ATP-binding protein [Agrococcus sp. ARC_14]|uniref:sensor histidine kinase n=1 Tax=Agrococcus sp. ARC_14 TaxID=2919927 RepID=UPI001F06BC39|nr:PAS domain-containing sensor histidine kinase [Agrococcus sp. ARC_14]
MQAILAIMVAMVLVVLTLVDADSWHAPWLWIATVGMGLATVLALATRKAVGPTLRFIVPTLDLIALAALIADPQAPRIVAILAVMPAFWLGVTARTRGIALVGAASAVLLAVMAMRIADSSGVTLTANAVGVVLVPIALVATAWFASNYTRTIERQQLAILHREREKLAIAKQSQADANLLDAIFETARVGLALLDPEGRVVRVNSTLADHPGLAGTTVAEALGDLRFLELESRRPIPEAETPFVRAASGEAFDNVICWIHRPGLEPVAATISSRPLLLDGDFRGSITSVDDVTNYMRMVEDRDDFVALVSHELRTPLTSITGFLELALDEEVPASLRGWLQIVQRNADRLRALVEDLLIVGEMSRGDVHLATRRLDLRALAVEAVATLEHRADRRGVALTLADGPAIEVDADERRITQVIENLISNGIKYTRDAGSVHVRVEVDGADARLVVVDDGAGVMPTEAARVFERFYRSSSARASGVQGAGLGLWICRMIIDQHGGSIDFASEVGRGSTATFSLPLAV